MRRYRRFIIFLICIATYVVAEWRSYRSTFPPSTVTDFPSFLVWRPDTWNVKVIQQGGHEYLFATGGGGGLIPSGPSGYVFDKTGQLVDWSSDIGDDPRFQHKWSLLSHHDGPPLDLGTARQWAGGGG